MKKKLSLILACTMFVSVFSMGVFAKPEGRGMPGGKMMKEQRPSEEKTGNIQKPVINKERPESVDIQAYKKDMKDKLKDEKKENHERIKEEIKDIRDKFKEERKESIHDEVYKKDRKDVRSVYNDVYKNEIQKKIEELRNSMKVHRQENKEKQRELMKKMVELRKEAKDKSVPVFVNGSDVSFDTAPVVKEGRVLIPVRAVSTALGADVKWDEATKTITVSKDVYVKEGITEKVVVVMKLESKEVTINGKKIEIEVPAKSYNGRVVVPIRFLVEAFKKKIEWDAKLNSIVIDD